MSEFIHLIWVGYLSTPERVTALAMVEGKNHVTHHEGQGVDDDEQWDDQDKVDLNGDGIKDIIPVGIRVGRGQGSHPVLHKDFLFITITGDGNDGGGSGNNEESFWAQKINLSKKKVRVTSWMQD